MLKRANLFLTVAFFFYFVYNLIMDKIYEQLIEIVKHSINQIEYDKNIENPREILNLSQKHGIILTVYPTLKNHPSLSAEQRDKLNSVAKNLISQQVHQDHYKQLIFNEFCNKNVNFIPLKGSFIRNVYPYDEMRFSSDVDIFVDKSQLKTAFSALTQLGLKFDHVYDGEHSFVLEPFLNVELHESLECHTTPDYYDDIINRIESNTCQKNFTPGDGYIYVILHTIKHFFSGGIGIRAVTDIYLLNKNLNLNREYVNGELKKLNASAFEREILNLAKVWFENNEFTPQLIDLHNYVLNSGIFGNFKNKTANDLKNKSKFTLFIYKIFPPISHLSKQYPTLKKFPILLPWFWIVRFFKAIFSKKNKISRNINAIKKTDEEFVKKQREIFDNLGL